MTFHLYLRMADLTAARDGVQAERVAATGPDINATYVRHILETTGW